MGIHLNFSGLMPHYKATLKLGIPIAIGQLGVIILGFADTMMVGRYSTNALASASFVTNFFNLVTFLLMGYSYGLTPLVSGCQGRGEYGKAGSMLRHALLANGVYALLLMSIMLGFYFYLPHMGQPVELLPLIRPYYVVILVSMFFVMLFNVARQFTDGITDTSIGMWVLISGNALNILGNWLLIGGHWGLPELGLLGAGFSTLFSRVCMAVAILCVIFLRPRYKKYIEGFRAGGFSRSLLSKINKMSFPVSLQMGVEAGAFSFSAIMAGWLGALELASFQVMMTMGTLGFLFYYSFGASMSIRIAHFAGQNDLDSVRLSAKAGSHVLFLMATVSSLIFFLCGKGFISLFSPDDAVQAMAFGLILPLILYQYADAMQICYSNALRGVSRVMQMMWVAFFSYILVGIPSSYIMGFVFGWGIAGIFLAFSVGLLTAMFLYGWQFFKALGEMRREPRGH